MIQHPAMQALVGQIQPDLIWAQVLIQRAEKGFDLRHTDDREAEATALRAVDIEGLRTVAQFTAQGAFRPLKSSPNLPSGWRFEAANEMALEQALGVLYPGSVADWWAAQLPEPPVTSYRDFTNRQTGMYRITQMLTDDQAAVVIRAGCHASVCLKRRMWTVAGLEPDAREGKSVIPCLELCAVLLEFARKAVRIEQSEKATLNIAEDDLETIREALRRAAAAPEPAVREGDTNQPGNPRRIRLALEKLALLPKKAKGGSEE